jgi:hypothetical protein
MEPTTTDDAGGEASAPKPPGSGTSGRSGPSVTLLVLTALGALVVGVVIGGVIGWQVEKQRVEDDIANIRPIGTITEVGDDSFTVNLSTSSGTREYQVTDETVVQVADTGSAGDLEPGSRVLVRSRDGDGGPEAIEVVVMAPESSGGG